jgi:hypothetical protein
LATRSGHIFLCCLHQCLATATAKYVTVEGQYLEKERQFGDSRLYGFSLKMFEVQVNLEPL